ncbi:hypothetical protein AAG906_020870 [Vitis piasezkii]
MGRPPRPWWTQCHSQLCLGGGGKKVGAPSIQGRRMAQGGQFNRQAITWSSSKGRLQVAPMDNFKIVLGMDFLRRSRSCHYLSYAQWLS